MTISSTLVFESTTFEVITRNDQPWLTMRGLAGALYGVVKGGGQSDAPFENAEKSLRRLYARNSAEFTDSMTAVIKLPTAGGMQDTRIFSLRGAHLLAMFARTAIAALFRKWVLDILDHQTQPAAPYSVAPDQTLSAEQAATLRGMLDEACKTLAKDLQGMFMTQGWGKLKAHFKTDYRHIPATQFTEAVSIVSRHIVKFSGTRVLPAPADDKPKFSLLQKRWLVYFDCNGVECAKPVPVDAAIISPMDSGDVHAFVNEMIPIVMLPKIIAMANNRISRYIDELSMAPPVKQLGSGPAL